MAQIRRIATPPPQFTINITVKQYPTQFQDKQQVAFVKHKMPL